MKSDWKTQYFCFPAQLVDARQTRPSPLFARGCGYATQTIDLKECRARDSTVRAVYAPMLLTSSKEIMRGYPDDTRILRLVMLARLTHLQ